MGDIATWVSLAVAIASAAFTGATFYDRRKTAREIHVAHISMEVKPRRSHVTDFAWRHHGDDIIVRNDGPSATTVNTVAKAYGTWSAVGAQAPFHWQLDRVPQARLERRLIPPGEEMKVKAPDDRSGIGVLGPVVTLTDTNGRHWQRTTWGWRELAVWARRAPRRRDLWFERQRWFVRIEQWLLKRAQVKARKRPHRLPWQVRLMDLLWGWRGGYEDGALLPWHAPRSWYYVGLIPRDISEASKGN